MFSAMVPDTKSKRDKALQKTMDQHQAARSAREATTKAAWESSARQDDFKRSMANTGGPAGKSSLAKRAEYQFEADSEDDEMENQIDNNLGTFDDFPYFSVPCWGVFLEFVRCAVLMLM
jgi:hypothetical protein